MTEPGEHRPVLSVVVPVRNEAVHVADVLEQIVDQSLSWDRYEVLVVDGRSEDATRDVVESFTTRYPHIRLLDNPGHLAGAARNIGARHAAGRYILFIDGHCRLASRDLLAESVAAFERGEQCLSRPQPLLTEDVSRFQRAASLARHSLLGHQAGSQIFTDRSGHCNPLSAGCAYSRDLYFALGGADETFDAAEDLEFNLRVHEHGVRAFHSPIFAVSYVPRGSWPALFRQLYRYGYGRARMARKHRSHVSSIAVCLGLVFLVLILLPFKVQLWAPALPLWVLMVAGYVLLSLTAAARAAWREGAAMVLRVAACFPAIHFGAGLGYLSGLVGGFAWTHAPDQPACAHNVEDVADHDPADDEPGHPRR